MAQISIDRWTRLRAAINSLAVRRLHPVADAVMRLNNRRQGNLLARLYDRYWIAAPVFTLTVAGRKTGEPRTVSLILTRRGDDIVVVGSYAGSERVPAWFLNLRAAQTATVEVDGVSSPVSVREVTDDAERAQCWELVAKTYPGIDVYAQRSAREFPFAILTPIG